MTVSLKDAAGVRIALSHGSLLIGRAPSCHVVVSDPHVSRQHVLLLEVESTVQVVPLGKGRVELGGRPVEAPTLVSGTETLTVGTASFTFEMPQSSAPPQWILEAGAHRYPIRRQGFVIGDDDHADLRLPSWPVGAVRLFPVTNGLLAEVARGVEVDSGRTDGELTRLTSGSRLTCAGLDVVVALSSVAPATVDLTPEPTEAALELMPNGALLKLMLDRMHLVWLPQKRGDLVAALLSPPQRLAAGDWVQDDLLLHRVWGNESASKAQLNTLVHRTRHSFTCAGVNGAGILERAPGGGATRMRLARNAAVSVA